jgi:hypothetical protein
MTDETIHRPVPLAPLGTRELRERLRQDDSTTVVWTARRFTAVEWYDLSQDRAAYRKSVHKSHSAATPCRFTVKDAYRVASEHRTFLMRGWRRLIEENWEGEGLAQHLERFDQRQRDLEARFGKSDPFVLALLLGGVPPRLRKYKREKNPRSVEPATRANRQRGAGTRAKVERAWATLAAGAMPEDDRAALIEASLGIRADSVRRIVRSLGLRARK